MLRFFKKFGLVGLILLMALVLTPIYGESWDFAVLGDCRPACFGASIPPVYSRILEELNLIFPDMVFHTGDCVLVGNDEVQSRRSFENFLGINQKLLPPLYIVPGNHDYNNPVNIKLYHQLISPKPYYSIDHKGCHFIMLNTELPGEIGEIKGKQLEWLKQDLTKNQKAEMIFVFMHRAMFSELNPNFTKNLKDNFRSKENRDMLAGLFTRFKVRAVFCAHEHLLSQKTIGGVTYVITGGAGAPIYRSPQRGGVYHYMLVEVNNGQAAISPHLPEDLFWSSSKDKGIEITFIGKGTILLGGIPLPSSETLEKLKINYARKREHYPKAEIVLRNGKG